MTELVFHVFGNFGLDRKKNKFTAVLNEMKSALSTVEMKQ